MTASTRPQAADFGPSWPEVAGFGAAAPTSYQGYVYTLELLAVSGKYGFDAFNTNA